MLGSQLRRAITIMRNASEVDSRLVPQAFHGHCAGMRAAHDRIPSPPSVDSGPQSPTLRRIVQRRCALSRLFPFHGDPHLCGMGARIAVQSPHTRQPPLFLHLLHRQYILQRPRRSQCAQARLRKAPMQHHTGRCLFGLVFGHGGQVGHFFGMPKAPRGDAHGADGQRGAREKAAECHAGLQPGCRPPAARAHQTA